MSDLKELLPNNATEFENAVLTAGDPHDHTDVAITTMRGKKLLSPLGNWLPFLIYEYGLGELTPYVENLFQLIDEGIDWQRIRGTEGAVDLSLSWLGYAAELEEFPARRKFWNMFMLDMDRLRDQEEPDLFQIDGVANLSAPLRSMFWRGFYDYDIRALELGYTKLGNVYLGSFSGNRIDNVAAKWSYGRRHFETHTWTEDELTELGVYVEPGSSLPWGAFAWEDTAIAWDASGEAARKLVMSNAILAQTCWFEMRTAADAVIGYRKARITQMVKQDPMGDYDVNGVKYGLATALPEAILFEAMTNFEDGDGAVLGSWGLIFGAKPVDPQSPGLLWALPGELELIRSHTNAYHYSEPADNAEATTPGGSNNDVSFLGAGVMGSYDGAIHFDTPGVLATAYATLSPVIDEPYNLSAVVEMLDGGGAPVFSNASVSSTDNAFAMRLGDAVDPTTYQVDDLGGGFYRVSVAHSPTAGTSVGFMRHSGQREFRVSAMQLTEGLELRPYIKSSGGAASADQDDIAFDNRVVQFATTGELGKTIRERFTALISY